MEKPTLRAIAYEYELDISQNIFFLMNWYGYNKS